MPNNDLSIIYDRVSVRRYSEQTPDEETLQAILVWAEEALPLFKENTYRVLVQKNENAKNLVDVLGGYGRISNPPYYLTPYICGGKLALTDCGFRTQQIVIELAQKGLGSCYLGTINKMDRVRDNFRLPQDAQIGAYLAFGHPTQKFWGKTINNLMHSSTGASNKLAMEEIFFTENFNTPAQAPREIFDLVEAGRRSPSALNAQPWRMLWKDEQLYLFVQRQAAKYGKGNYQNYRYYDSGVCMGNISMALKALKRSHKWLVPDLEEAPQHPGTLELVAKLVL